MRSTSAGRGGRAGQRSGGEDQLVVGAERVDLGVDLLDQILGGQAAQTKVLLGPIHIERFGLDGAFGEVDP